MAYSRELQCRTCRKPGVSIEVIGRFNNSEGLFCASCGKRYLKAVQDIETGNLKLERERPDLKGKLR